MKKIALIYGSIAGVVIIISMLLGMVLLSDDDGNKHFSVWLGYLTMLVALSMIFVGIKRYRDEELGGTIRFGTALLLGLAISLVAGVAYVVSWEIHLVLTDYAFIAEYTEAQLREAREAGVSGEALLAKEAEMATMREQYARPIFRLPMTFLEIFPIGLLVSVISAAVLKRPDALPANR